MLVAEKLNELERLEAEIEAIRLEKQQRIDDILTKEIKLNLNQINNHYQETINSLQGFCQEIETEIKAEVLAGGATVKGDKFQAVYVKGRTSWDSKALSGYAIAHPEINDLRKVGNPSVRIKK